jgi:type II secretory pathway pseudopilin PulG
MKSPMGFTLLAPLVVIAMFALLTAAAFAALALDTIQLR